MASNPLPPARAQARHGRHRGRARGRHHGRRTAACCRRATIGEIVIRGPERHRAATRTIPRPTPAPSPTAGSAPATRARSTREGYSDITGRLKEIINRGGEKISPREVDEVLMEHPAVAQVRHLRHAARQARRGGRGGRRAARGHERQRARDPRLRGRAARRLQGAAQARLPRRDPQGRHRQAAADRARGEAGPAA